MPIAFTSASEPLSSSEIPVIDAERIVEIEQRHRRVSELLDSVGCFGLLLQRPANIAWFTSGVDLSRGARCESTAALLITADARLVLTSNIDSPQIFDCQLPSLGFQLKERVWTESRQSLLDDLCRGRSMASDAPGPRLTDVSPRLAALRSPLGEVETRRLRDLGRDLTHAVEATARGLVVGRTEMEIAGEISHRMMKRGILPERIQAAGDGRTRVYRHWSYGDRPVNRFCVLSAVGRRHGLHCGVTRIVSFGEPSESLWEDFARTSLVHATAMYFSHSGWSLSDVWGRMQRIYEKFGCADEWRNCEQGEIIGYSPCEAPVLPRSEYPLEPGTAIHWHPSAGAALMGDTILVGADKTERVTGANESWPLLVVQVKGTEVSVPDILRRPAAPLHHAAAVSHGATNGHANIHLPGLHGETELNGSGDSILNITADDSVMIVTEPSHSVLD
jgi:Xaa-Pro aminopeptidase